MLVFARAYEQRKVSTSEMVDGPKVGAGNSGLSIEGLGRDEAVAQSHAAPARRPVRHPDPYPQNLEDGKPDLLVASYEQMADDSKPVLADHLAASTTGGVVQASKCL